MKEVSGYIALFEKKEFQKSKLREAAAKEADRLAVLLKKEFEYEALYLIGSVVKGRGRRFNFHSDIDLVIKGLNRDLFFKVLALLIKNSAFRIDLKPWEELDCNSKAMVEEEGGILQ